jgi:hypothetical protein
LFQDGFDDLHDLENSLASFPIKPLQALKYDFFFFLGGGGGGDVVDLMSIVNNIVYYKIFSEDHYIETYLISFY